ncbi:PBP1A family penicillin-binding protein [Alphaproteobacteria bacterium GH1-50]|uniref:peptidoglycan glycosyltransferase n=1 Tax=Kangsaoukella pontilimi TaxID=2691042 RepID=A0A7C9NG35_9RHOB|nr:PBP1A family penicillin-binding protein [Kangsaoukella pontilimi]MXQ09179.1 PBP1A family penicillin-binding protein [Kangsaoukella pontilimi]
MSGSKKGGSRLVADKRPKKSKPAPAARTKRKRRTSRSRRRGPIAWLFGGLFRFVWGIGWRVTALVALAVGGAVLYYAATLPPVTALLDGRSKGSVTLLDRDGEVFAWRGEQFGGQITAETVSPDLKNAIIATEDRRFYRHFGISPRGIASAVRINLSEGRGPLSGHGGSTITQQTAKLLCLGTVYDPASGLTEAEFEADCRRTTIARKIKEAVYAMAMELRYSKDDILTIYLNRAYLGAGSRGFEAAAQRYFGRSANEVLPSEAAMLAGLLVAPTRYAPTANLERSQNRANLILGLMEEQGYLTTAEATRARQNPARLSEAAEARAGGYFADWVMDQGPTYLTDETTEDVIIRTTFDQRIQNAAEEALQWVFDNKVREGSKAQAAIVVMSADGAVRGMVGGRKFRGVAGQFNRAIQAKRQTGSAFKPFVYGAALDLGYSPNDTVIDEPYCLDIPGSGRWCPSNYTNDYKGRVTMTDALAQSLNIPAVKVFETVGREAVVNIANDFGIESDIAGGPAVALGASESTLLEMTGAFAGILNGGSSVDPYGLVTLSLKGDTSPLLEQEGGIGERVITPKAAQELVWMMHQVIERGTGTRAKLPGGHPAAGKTGTTQAARDAWFIGFTADYVAGVWMGYDDNTPLSGVTGGGLPAEIWRETMARVHEGTPPRPLPMIAPAQQAPQVARDQTAPRRQTQPDNAVERVILNVLNELFGN